VPLKQDVRDPVLREGDGGREADGAAADDCDGVHLLSFLFLFLFRYIWRDVCTGIFQIVPLDVTVRVSICRQIGAVH